MRDLVHHRAASGVHAFLSIEDRARVLGAAAETGGLDVGQLLVWVGTDLSNEEIN